MEKHTTLKDSLLSLLGNTNYPETERDQLLHFLNDFQKENKSPLTFFQKTSTFNVPAPNHSFKYSKKNIDFFWKEVNEYELKRGWEAVNFSLTKNWFRVLPSGYKMENFTSFNTNLYLVYSKNEVKEEHEYRTHPVVLNEAERCGIKKIYTPHQAFSVIKHAILSGQIDDRQSGISAYYEVEDYPGRVLLYIIDVTRDATHNHLWVTSEEVTYNGGYSHLSRISFY